MHLKFVCYFVIHLRMTLVRLLCLWIKSSFNVCAFSLKELNRRSIIEWCLENSFEFIELYPDDNSGKFVWLWLTLSSYNNRLECCIFRRRCWWGQRRLSWLRGSGATSASSAQPHVVQPRPQRFLNTHISQCTHKNADMLILIYREARLHRKAASGTEEWSRRRVYCWPRASCWCDVTVHTCNQWRCKRG